MNQNYRLYTKATWLFLGLYMGFATTAKAQSADTADKIDEVVVVGYGTAKKKEFTGANSALEGEKLEKMNIPRMDQALQGQMSGVTINTNSGSPGGSSSIRIRGLSTFGDNDPLILVDGVVYDSEGLNALNPSDIASINVLKDATAGIYGVRAANGVIVIETKKGKRNMAPRFEFSGYEGFQQTAKKLDLLNATEYATLKNEMFANGGNALPFRNTQLGVGTNWQDSVFQSAPVRNYNLSVQGGTDVSTYSIGGSYFKQEGIVGGPKASFERINGRVNFQTKLSETLRFNHVGLYTHERRSGLPENGIGSVLYNTINAFPTDPIRDENGRFSYLEKVADIINPIAQMRNTFNWSHVNKFVGKEELEWDLMPGLTWTNRINYNVALVDNKVFSPLVWYGTGKAQNTAINANLDAPKIEIAPNVEIERGASVYEGRFTYTDLNYESFMNYQKEIAKRQTLKATLGASVFSREGSGLDGVAYDIPNNSLEFADISANLAPGGILNQVNSFQFQERLVSAFLRTEYNYFDKYILSGILRRDGSSRFGPNSRYGWFPSISGSWVISEEDFYDLKAVRYLKLRASYGVSGNDQIPNFAYRGLLNGEGDYVFNDIIVKGVAIGRAANPDLKWETTRQFNLGLDVTLFRDWDVTFNYFVKNTYDLLFQPQVSALLGTSGAGGYPPIVNAGNVHNQGLELETGYRHGFKNGLRLNVNFNATYLYNRVMETPDGVDFIPGAGFGVGGNIATRFQKGHSIGYFHGYEVVGVYQSQAEINNATVKQEGAKPGDFIYKDQNGDGKISFSDDSDRTFLGSPIPKFTFGFNTSVSWLGFDLSANFYAAVGQKIIRNYERQQPYANQLSYTINRWSGPNSTNEQSRLTTELTRNNVFSSFYVEDGSFLRLRNLQLGYTFNPKWVAKQGMQSVRIYVAANNLFTLTRYMGFDPDIGSMGGPLGAGIDYGFYPQARNIMFGFNFNF
jgi:TonB-dependent starch-binding outer membrane protein SusC